MPSRLNTPVLTLDAAKIHQIDPRNVESLFGMWTVFNKCSQSIKDGSRLENMSWRVWARETLCCPPQPEHAIVPSIDIDVPSLSSSVASDDSVDEENTAPLRSTSRRRKSTLNDGDSALLKSRGQEKHLTPETLEKIVTTIQEKTVIGPLSPSLKASIPTIAAPDCSLLANRKEQTVESQILEDSCTSATTQDTTSTNRHIEHRNSDTSVSSDGLIRSGSVVHGFASPATSLRAKPGFRHLSSSSRLSSAAQAAKPGMFMLGGSSEDDDSSFEQRVMTLRPTHKRSSLSQSLTEQDVNNPTQKKKTSFRDVIEAHRIQEDTDAGESAVESCDEDEDDDIIDSAIEEDDDENWEDSHSEDGKHAHQNQHQHLFRRVDSRHNLASRRSLLTTALTEPERAKALMGAAIRSTPTLQRSRNSSRSGPSLPGSPTDHDGDAGCDGEGESGMMMHRSGTRPVPIITPTPSARAMAQSPRTTRRNMLSTELTESLRKNLLWERQQKSQTANAFLKRNRNAQSMANLQVHATAPQPLTTGRYAHETSRHNSFNQYFENQWEYHNKGW